MDSNGFFKDARTSFTWIQKLNTHTIQLQQITYKRCQNWQKEQSKTFPQILFNIIILIRLNKKKTTDWYLVPKTTLYIYMNIIQNIQVHLVLLLSPLTCAGGTVETLHQQSKMIHQRIRWKLLILSFSRVWLQWFGNITTPTRNESLYILVPWF